MKSAWEKPVRASVLWCPVPAFCMSRGILLSWRGCEMIVLPVLYLGWRSIQGGLPFDGRVSFLIPGKLCRSRELSMANDIHKYDIIIVNNLLNLKIECYRLPALWVEWCSRAWWCVFGKPWRKVHERIAMLEEGWYDILKDRERFGWKVVDGILALERVIIIL